MPTNRRRLPGHGGAKKYKNFRQIGITENEFKSRSINTTPASYSNINLLKLAAVNIIR